MTKSRLILTYDLQVAAILLYGNPRHMPNQTYNVGNASAFDATGVCIV